MELKLATLDERIGSATLDELINIDGIVCAIEFNPDGSLSDYRDQMDMPSDIVAMTAQLCATVCMTFNTLASSHSQVSGMKWAPQQGWTYSGGDWTVACGGNRAVFVQTERADFNQLYQSLAR